MRPLTAGEEDLEVASASSSSGSRTVSFEAEEPTERTPLLQTQERGLGGGSGGGGGGGDRGRHATIEQGVLSPKSGKSLPQKARWRSKRSESSTPTSYTDMGSTRSQSDLLGFFQRQLGRDMNLTPRAREAEKHYRPPSSRSLVFQHIILLSGYVVYMLTSWVYCCFERAALFQKCSLVWPSRDSRFARWGEVACFVSTLLWWTFPLLCCWMLIVHFYRDLMHTRIWYEMFAHKVVINFECKNFLATKKARFLLLWFTLGSTFYVFEKKYAHWAAVQATFPYWLPLISFALVLYNQWSLDNMLLSVAKFVGNSVDNCKWAGDHLSHCYYTTDHDAGRAWKKAYQEFCDGGDRSDSDDSATETEESVYFPEGSATSGASSVNTPARCCNLEREEEGHEAGDEDKEEEERKVPTLAAGRWHAAPPCHPQLPGSHTPTFTTGRLIQALRREMRRREKQAFRKQISSPGSQDKGISSASQPTLEHSTSSGSLERPLFWKEVDFSHNWVRLFLYSQRLEDDHAKRFRRWFNLFHAYLIFLYSGLLYLSVATLICHFVHQEMLVLPEGPGLTGWVRRLAVQPLDALQDSMKYMRHVPAR